MARKFERLHGKAHEIHSAYTGFPFRGEKTADAKTRKRRYFLIKKERILNLWNDASREVRAMAQLLIISQSFERLPFAVDGVTLSAELIDAQEGAAFISSMQSWNNFDPNMAEEIASDIRQDLMHAGCNMANLCEEDIIAAFPIETKLEANLVAKKLQELSDINALETTLFRGLLRALTNWIESGAKAAMPPPELIEFRKNLGHAQTEMAEAIGISPRQYIRYENGETRISGKMAKKIKALT